jgi:hypothetical protein
LNAYTSNKTKLDTIGQSLTKPQKLYLKQALDNTIERYGLRISAPHELWSELCFAILNPQQRQGVTTFRHAVNRCMRLLAQKRWRRPSGFYQHDDQGRQMRARQHDWEQAWQSQKAEECRQSQAVMRELGGSEALCPRPDSSGNDPTGQAVMIVQRLRQMQRAEQERPEQATPRLAQELSQQLKRCIQLGADKQRVKAVWQNNDNLGNGYFCNLKWAN